MKKEMQECCKVKIFDSLSAMLIGESGGIQEILSQEIW
jgi:hypothetical protein